jgi:hypothetical protein
MSTKRMRRYAAILKVSEDEWKFLMDETAGVDPWTDYFLEYDYAGSLGKFVDYAYGLMTDNQARFDGVFAS